MVRNIGFGDTGGKRPSKPDSASPRIDQPLTFKRNMLVLIATMLVMDGVAFAIIIKGAIKGDMPSIVAGIAFSSVVTVLFARVLIRQLKGQRKRPLDDNHTWSTDDEGSA